MIDTVIRFELRSVYFVTAVPLVVLPNDDLEIEGRAAKAELASTAGSSSATTAINALLM
jgi:hypothetical protein